MNLIQSDKKVSYTGVIMSLILLCKTSPMEDHVYFLDKKYHSYFVANNILFRDKYEGKLAKTEGVVVFNDRNNILRLFKSEGNGFFSDGKVFFETQKNNVIPTIELKNINYDENEKNDFNNTNKNHWFINPPTFRYEDQVDIEIIEKIFEFIQLKLNKKLILITASNHYKDHFYSKMGIISTKKSICLDMNLPSLYLHDDGGHRNYMYIKEKGSMSSLLTDLMYIQECEDVGFIHFNNLINLYYDDLLLYGLNSFENHPYLKQISEGRKGQFIDWIGTELKLSKVFRCNTVLNRDEVKN